MGCSFCSYSPGLNNLPEELPEGSLLVVSDQVPPQSHDPEYISQQLNHYIRERSLKGMILDFQRPYDPKTAEIVLALQDTLPCPVAVTPGYLKDWKGAVFLPPIPVNESVTDHLRPYDGRDIWLELDGAGTEFIVTSAGCTRQPYTQHLREPIFYDEAICCHYDIQVFPDNATFRLVRTWEDQKNLVEAAQAMGVRLAIGLYQELG